MVQNQQNMMKTTYFVTMQLCPNFRLRFYKNYQRVLLIFTIYWIKYFRAKYLANDNNTPYLSIE